MKILLTPRRLACSAAALALAAGLAHAEPPPTAPTDTAAPLEVYQSWRDAPVADWRAANERVHAVGGWRTYLRESQGDAASGDDPHAHHHHH